MCGGLRRRVCAVARLQPKIRVTDSYFGHVVVSCRLAPHSPAREPPGQYTLLARAKDANGNVQPDEHDQYYGTYVINHPLPIEVFVHG
jgi:hypothetical protein